MDQIKEILEKLNMRVITFIPLYARLFGGNDEAIFFQQIFFWCNKGWLGNGIIYKSDQELEKETNIPSSKLYRIRKKLQKLGVIDIWREKIKGAPTNHYKINFDTLKKMILDSGDLLDSSITEKTTERKEFPVKEGNSTSSKKRNRSYKNEVTTKLVNLFSELCVKILRTTPVIGIKEHCAITYAMNTGNLSEAQIIDLFDEWFKLGKSDEETISINRALSGYQINGYKLRNNVHN